MKIAILYTGSTIGCFFEPLRPLQTSEFERLFNEHVTPALKAKYESLEIEYIKFGPPTLDSTNLEPLDWCTLAELILSKYNDCDGFIVLHGTDTMAYSASALSFLFTSLDAKGHYSAMLTKPIVVTGSQVPIFYGKDPETAVLRFDTDAFQNVCGAVAAAQSNLPEVCLFFNHYLYRGNRTAKVSANQFDAFKSPNFPPLAETGINFTLNHKVIRPMPPTAEVSLSSPQALDRVRKQLEAMKKHISTARVTPFMSYPSANRPPGGDGKSYLAHQLEAVLHLGDDNLQLKGIILESYGEGNFPSGDPSDPTKGAVYRALSKASDAGVIIVDNTQVLGGVVDPNAYAAGSWLSDHNIKAVGAFDMTPIATYTKLMYLLTLGAHYGWDTDTVRRLLAKNLVGEMQDVYYLDAQGEGFLSPGECITSADGTARLTNVPRKGPQLTLKDSSTGTWGKPVFPSETKHFPDTGRFHMETNGNLVLRSSSNTLLWESGTAHSDQSSSRLILTGQTDPGGVSLFVYNYVRNVVTKQLYPPP